MRRITRTAFSRALCNCKRQSVCFYNQIRDVLSLEYYLYIYKARYKGRTSALAPEILCRMMPNYQI